MAINFPEGTQDYPSRVTRWFQTDRSDRASLSGRDTNIMTLNISPRSTSSRLLIMCNVGLCTNSTTIGMKLTVNGNNIDPLVGDASSNRGRYSAVNGTSNYSWVASMGMCVIYHPNSTSTQTIRCNVGSHDGRAFYLNRSNASADTNNIDEATTTSVLTVLELEE